MTTKNSNLQKAKVAKNDEFYTKLSDIENELKHYREHFKGKVVFLNCDDPKKSNFWRFFSEMNFEFLGLKRVISTHFESDIKSYKLETFLNEEGMLTTVETPLIGNGDFRSPESVELLKQADIVVTNPPFSLFREYIDQLIEHDKKFLVVGSLNAITYKEVFKHILNEKLWLGVNYVKEFILPSGDTQKFGNILWFTNLEHKKRREEIVTFAEYNDEEYPTYDNYDAINVDKVAFIPKNYYGAMGVPITYLMRHNPSEYKIVGCMEPCIALSKLEKREGFKLLKSRQTKVNGIPCQKTYHRILIQRINKEEVEPKHTPVEVN